MQPLAQNGYTTGEVLAALRRTTGTSTVTFRYERLDQANRLLGDLDNVLDGRVTQNYLADIKRTANFRVLDDGSINYLSDRIKPWVRIALPSSDRTFTDELAAVPSPLLRWAFDEQTGATTAADATGNNRTGAVSGGVTTGLPALVSTGSSYNFTTSASAIVTSPGASGWLAGLRRLTVATWIRADAVGHDRGWLSGKTPAGSADSSLGARFAATGTLGGAANCVRVWVTLDDGTRVAAETAAGTATTATTSVMWTWQSGVGIRVWLNGQPAALSATANFGAVGGIGDVDTLTVGRAPGSSQGWGGRIDDVALWAATIDDTTALAIHRSGLSTGPYGDTNFAEWPQGVFLLTSPTRDSDANGVVVRDVDAYDQLLVLRDDKVSNRFAAASGTKYTDQVVSLLSGAGILQRNVTPSPLLIPVTREWDPGTSKLQIVNDLLGAINYESLFFDEHGTAVARPYVSPQGRASEHTYTADSTSVIFPGVRQSLDLFGVPNKWTLVVSDPDRTGPLVISFTNSDPASPTSTVSRGRTIVEVRTVQDAPNLLVLDGLASRVGFEASQVYEEVTFPTALMPFHSHADVYTLTYPDLGVSDKYSERQWEMSLRAGAMMAHIIRRVVNV